MADSAPDRVRSELNLAFGQELQQERERRDISLASIAEGTKVPQRHLLALEMERFDQLPGGIFAKGIVRSYCRHLGLNEEEWLHRFPGCKPEDQAAEWTEFAENVSRARLQTGERIGLRWWGVVLMVAALGMLSWAAWQYVVQPQVLGQAAARCPACRASDQVISSPAQTLSFRMAAAR
jgi:cytoskeleton protein RodZ